MKFIDVVRCKDGALTTAFETTVKQGGKESQKTLLLSEKQLRDLLATAYHARWNYSKDGRTLLIAFNTLVRAQIDVKHGHKKLEDFRSMTVRPIELTPSPQP